MLRLSKLVLLSLLVIISIPVHGQSFCGDLSRDDCEILQTAQSATSNLDAAGFEMTMDISFGIQFLPNLITAHVVANGVYSRVPVTRNDLEAPYNDLFGLNADMSVLVDAAVSEFVLPENNTLTTALDLRYVDGIGYAELSKVLPLISPYAEIGSWYSADMVDYLS
ncbi:MAG TPA: hypothetical protein PLZ51_25805, partial [Aggregatilineales bacterium]|nr:hypothetical protein [Aggregatilineales bacterium]